MPTKAIVAGLEGTSEGGLASGCAFLAVDELTSAIVEAVPAAAIV